MKKSILISIDEKSLHLIDQVAKKEKRSRSNYIEYVAMKEVQKKISEECENEKN
jgi:metal-responsive CopG/Arc/MetJ family transcriptional regulator